MQLFDDERFRRMADQLRESYAKAEPYPHIAIDDFLPTEVCEGLLREFPSRDTIDWYRFEKHYSKKLATKGEAQFGDYTRGVLQQLNGAAFLQFLERLTGINGLIPDPYFEGGGLHQIERDGFLKIHIDFNKHPKFNLDRRINFILYLNKDWREEYNGHLELWDRTMSRCVRKVLPVYNRCVVFSTTDWSYHGHPEKLTCPPGMTRKSLALYYYSNGRPAEEGTEAHKTLWQERPGTQAAPKGLWSKTLRGVTSALKDPAKVIRKRTN